MQDTGIISYLTYFCLLFTSAGIDGIKSIKHCSKPVRFFPDLNSKDRDAWAG